MKNHKSDDNNNVAADFELLSPDVMLDAVELALDVPMSGLAAPLPSYINRVYEMQAASGRRVITKFYRPGRWQRAAIEQEHQFVLDCAEQEIPVVAPIILRDGKTIGSTTNNIMFAVYPKRSGREIEIISDETYQRIGMMIARIHLAGQQSPAPDRLKLHPDVTTALEAQQLLADGSVTPSYQHNFEMSVTKLLQQITPLFNSVEYIRIHGDCHRGNILERPDEGIIIIDFDDMMMGTPVQDLWLLLPDYIQNCRHEYEMMLEGYCQIRSFDRSSIKLIEPLRAMRQIYFLAWCGKQKLDYQFQHNFPDWGNDQFWRREIADLDAMINNIINQC
jgi:Ser/Thr protein kinase RdoA (MazF antagonist)